MSLKILKGNANIKLKVIKDVGPMFGIPTAPEYEFKLVNVNKLVSKSPKTRVVAINKETNQEWLYTDSEEELLDYATTTMNPVEKAWYSTPELLVKFGFIPISEDYLFTVGEKKIKFYGVMSQAYIGMLETDEDVKRKIILLHPTTGEFLILNRDLGVLFSSIGFKPIV